MLADFLEKEVYHTDLRPNYSKGGIAITYIVKSLQISH